MTAKMKWMEIEMLDFNISSRLKLPRLVGYSLGLFAIQTFWGFTWATLPLYLKSLTRSNAVTGIILSTVGITGLIFPILAGAVSDRISTRLGRRRPLIVAGWALTCMMVLILMNADTLWKILPVIFLAYAGFFFAIGPYFALFSDIVPEAQRSSASGVMFLVGGSGILSYLIFAARSWEVSHHRPFIWVMLVIPISVTLMCISAKETVLPGSVKHSGLLKGHVRKKNIMKFFLAFSLQWISLWMFSSFFVIAFKAYFGLTVESAVSFFFVLNASSVIFALPAGLLAPRLGLKKTIIGGICIMMGCYLIVPFVKAHSSLVVLMMISGLGFGTVLAASYPFFLDILPQGNTGGFTGIYQACQNGTLLIGPALAGTMIDHFSYISLFYGCAVVMLASMMMYLMVHDSERKI